MLEITFLLNDRMRSVRVEPTQTALDLLRSLGLSGVHEGCGEGDCGACTVAFGTPGPDGMNYRSVCSCILPAARLHGCHVLTTEGLGTLDHLHPVQQALVENHAVQCGFCTPGVVMSLFCLLVANPDPDDEALRAALEGNLCRCTGYEPMLLATGSLVGHSAADRNSLLPGSCATAAHKLGRVPALTGDSGWYAPRDIRSLRRVLRDQPGARIVCGGTDVMPSIREGATTGPLLDVSSVSGMQTVELNRGRLCIGAALPLADIAGHAVVRRELPVLADTIGQMASAQVRNVATIGGNIANASPVADAAVLLLALNTTLVLVSAHNERRVGLSAFYLGYKRTVLEPGEVITSVEIPLSGMRASFIKTGKRSAVDIASVNSALAVRPGDGVIEECRFAVGGCAEYPMLCPGAASGLAGRKQTAGLAQAAATAAAAEVDPIADVRGSAGFRRGLVEGQFLEHWDRLFPEVAE